MSDQMRLARCVCSHPKAIHIGGETCTRGCKCWNGRFAQSAAGYTESQRKWWERWLQQEAA